jgi:hypothetical protein
MNVGQSVKYTYETAPREVSELALIGRFRLRDLAMSLGMGESAETRSAMATMSAEDLIKIVAAKIAQMDAENGGAPAQQAPQAIAPQAPAQPAQVHIPAAAATPAATAVTTAPPKRSPRTATAAAQQTPNAAPAALPQEMQTALAATQAALIAVQTQLNTLGPALAAISNTANASAAQLKELLFQQKVNTALSLFFAEETLGGSRPEILEQALVDLEDISAIVGKARQGK